MTGKGPVIGGSSSRKRGNPRSPRPKLFLQEPSTKRSCLCRPGPEVNSRSLDLELLLGEGKLVTRGKSESSPGRKSRLLLRKEKHTTQLKPTPDFYMPSWKDSKLTYQQGPGVCHRPLRRSSQCHPSQSPEEYCNHQGTITNSNTDS